MKTESGGLAGLGIVTIMVVILVFLYISFQVDSYHAWVKNTAIDDFRACRAFNFGAEGERYCMEYARGPGWSPYPFWKALLLINPNI